MYNYETHGTLLEMGPCRSCKRFVKIIATITFISPGILLHIYSCSIKLMFGKERLACLTLSLGTKF